MIFNLINLRLCRSSSPRLSHIKAITKPLDLAVQALLPGAHQTAQCQLSLGSQTDLFGGDFSAATESPQPPGPRITTGKILLLSSPSSRQLTYFSTRHLHWALRGVEAVPRHHLSSITQLTPGTVESPPRVDCSSLCCYLAYSAHSQTPPPHFHYVVELMWVAECLTPGLQQFRNT